MILSICDIIFMDTNLLFLETCVDVHVYVVFRNELVGLRICFLCAGGFINNTYESVVDPMRKKNVDVMESGIDAKNPCWILHNQILDDP